ncbi:GNAT family N-acetyltransferase [Bacillus infantis]|uniref:GNAT family N-acetyltransferase n=1 Tax=Bacillus infantis TaxID=324767 RepID=A0A5D4RKB3_9BACI|nr:GNAT family N-acetyltransferase [Bacillus infantis]TYS51895.1 GNAT family N-acetyltransferase [Bacillus infantis]
MKVRELKSLGEKELKQLSVLLADAVNSGASIGFLPPMDEAAALSYWKELQLNETALLIAEEEEEGTIAGSVQLQFCTKENGSHRAEIGKLMTHTNFRRKGIGRRLMEAAEKKAMGSGVSLIVLDTREGDPSNLLYRSLNYIESGMIPCYARSEDGSLHTTVFYHKLLS